MDRRAGNMDDPRLQTTGRMEKSNIHITYPRLFALVWLLAGAGILFLGFDMRFLHNFDWQPQAKESAAFFLLFVGIGGALAYPSFMALLFPKTLLKATKEGITVYAVTTEDKWNDGTEEFERVVKSGDPKLIEWCMVESLGVGTLRIAGRSKTQTNQGTMPMEMKALRILCDPSVMLDGFTREGILHARTGTSPEAMEASERANFTEQEFEDYQKSEILLPAKYVKVDMGTLVKQLEALRG